jgi:hypothetical protein
VLGTATRGKWEGHKFNIHCTIAGFRRLRDAEKEHGVFVNGQMVCLSDDDPGTGLRKYIFCIKHKAGVKIRYWLRKDGVDVPEGARYFVLTDDETGYRQLTRHQF